MPLVYYSGSLGSTSHRPRFIDMCEARLLSCHGQYLNTAKRWLADAHGHVRAKQRYIMLDSGAFTGWSRGEHITLDEVRRNYSSIVERYAPFYKTIYLINLDVIPGSKGETPTRKQVAAALVESDKNYEILNKEFGDVVLPVFHQGEGEKRLHEVAAQNPNYICVSPRNDLSESQRVPWAQRVHAEIPSLHTHGLAATGVNMMLATGFFSVDSATWVQIAGFGGILVETVEGGMTILKISSDSPDRRFFDGHYDSKPKDVKLQIQNLADSLDLSIADLRTSPGGREWFNLNTLERVSTNPLRSFNPQMTLWEL
jgi:hypothetical protein